MVNLQLFNFITNVKLDRHFYALMPNYFLEEVQKLLINFVFILENNHNSVGNCHE